MKKLNALLILLVTAFAAFAASPKVSFPEKKHDFGTIKEADGAVTYTFRFTNDGDAPLVIVSAKADCGCTVPKYPMHPIAPGEDGAIVVTFNPRGYSGEFSKDVKVRTSDKSSKTVKLRISGVVIPERNQ